MISPGTISVLAGCHSPIHSLLVIMSWRKLYGSFPKLWQIVCIFLHDIGHWGKNYLDDYEAKKVHWILGAEFAMRLFGRKAYFFVASRDVNSPYINRDGPLYKSDKYSWFMAPYWWQYLNCIFEPKLRTEDTIDNSIKIFNQAVKKSIESGSYQESHSFYLNRCKNGGE